jgi:hypothetical protein
MSNITCNNISYISYNNILSKIYQINNDYNQFELFLETIITLMTISKKYSQYIKIDVLRRKINQYTHWNIFMIIANSMLYNVFNIDNYLISRFIAINSFQIMSLFHLYILYDSNILFYATTDIKPYILKYNIFNKITDFYLVRFEYFICNIIAHILPVYIYKDYLTIKEKGNNDINTINANAIYEYNKINMFQYIVIFKFMWVLNIFGDFNITAIYVPSFNWCNVKLINLVIVIDFIIYKLLNNFLYKI